MNGQNNKTVKMFNIFSNKMLTIITKTMAQLAITVMCLTVACFTMVGQAQAQISLPPIVDGVLDTGFFPPANSTVSAIAVRDDRRVIIGGFFTTSGGLNRNRLAVLNPDGSLDTEFPNISVNNGGVLDILIQSDGSFIIAGSFTTITVPDGTANGNTVTRNRVARFSAEGVLDTDYDPNLSGTVNVLASQTIDGEEHVLIGGSFLDFFTGRSHIARVLPSGVIDFSFIAGTASPSSSVQSIAVTPDNQVLIGGTFDLIFNAVDETTIARDNIALLNVDGTVDTSFNAGNINLNGNNGSVNGILVQEDGQIVILGAFTSVGGVSRLQFARLNPNGSVEAGYNEDGFDANGADIGGIQGLFDGLLQADGKLIVVGSINVNFQNAGSIVPNIIRVNTDGTYDPTFTASNSNPVSALGIQPFDNAILVGSFPAGVSGGGNSGFHSGVARLGNSVLPVFNFTAEQVNTVQSAVEGDTNSLVVPEERRYNIEIVRSVNTDIISIVSLEVVGSGENPTSADDFSLSFGLVADIIFDAGQTRTNFTFAAAGDIDIEPDETFSVRLTGASNGVVGQLDTIQGVIPNDDFESQIGFASLAEVVQNEGNGGASAPTAFSFQLNRSGGTNAQISVDYQVVPSGDSPAQADDFFGGQFPSGTATFPAGEATTNFAVSVLGDGAVEPDETFTVQLSNPVGLGELRAGETAVNARINNDDQLAQLAYDLSTNALDAAEGSAGSSTTLSIDVVRTVNTVGVVSVDYTITRPNTSNSTLFPDDFITADGVIASEFPSGTLTFADGVDRQTIEIFVTTDDIPEVDEGYILTLSDESENATILSGGLFGVIRNDDPRAVVGFTETIFAAPQSQLEGDSGTTPFTFALQRSGNTLVSSTVEYNVVGDGNIDADSDDFSNGANLANNIFPQGTVTFNPGETSRTITVDVVGDDNVEQDEQFSVNLTNVSIGVTELVFARSVVFGVILNDDFAPATVGFNPAIDDLQFITEGDSDSVTLTLEVIRGANVDREVTVDFQVLADAASPNANAADFVNGLPQGTLTFAANDTSETITIEVAGDLDTEPDDFFTVRLSNPSADVTLVSGQAERRFAIRNNDTVPVVSVTNEQPNFSQSRLEGDEGDITTFPFELTRSSIANGVSTVRYTITASQNVAESLDGADFVGGVAGGPLPTGIARFEEGATTTIINVQVRGDNEIEPNEIFALTISADESEDANATIVTGFSGRRGAVGTILGDDLEPSNLSFDSSAVNSQAEGDAGTTTYSFVVNRGLPNTTDVTVDYVVSGTGANGATAADFVGGQFPSGTLEYGFGVNTQTITVAVAGDFDVEADEAFVVTLSNPSDNALITSGEGQASGLIVNDDALPEVGFANNDVVAINEGQANFTFTVNRDIADGNNATSQVSYTVAGSGANPANADDFTSALQGTLNFAQGVPSQTITVSVADDSVVELDENFTVTLSTLANGNAQLNQNSTAQGQIINNDFAVISFDADPSNTQQSANEGAAGQLTSFTFEVTRADSVGTSSVDFAVVGTGANPASASDFQNDVLPTGTVSFAPGVSSQNVTVVVVGDDEIEQDETFTIQFSNPVGAVIDGASNPIATITNDDFATPVVGFAANSVNISQAEGSSSNSTFTFTVNRTVAEGDNSTSQVTYTVAGSGANPANADDFAGALQGTLNFAQGVPSQTISVVVAGDFNVETNEDFTVTLAVADNATLGTATATGTIENDDSVALTRFDDGSTNVQQTEGNGGTTTYSFVLNRVGNTQIVSTVGFEVIGVTANSADFVGGSLPSGEVEFAVGDTSAIIEIEVVGDTVVEGDESFEVNLIAQGGNVLDLPFNATGTIINDDSFDTPLVGFASDSIIITENEGDTGNTAFTFTVSRGIESGDNSTSQVTYTVAGSGANPANADDFAGALQGTINFAQGVTSQPITVLVAGDSDVEPDENFTVTLAVTDNATLGTVVATGTITNDDAVAIVAFDADSTSISQNEGDGGQTTNYTFQVNRTVNTSGVVTVDFEVTGGVGSLARVGDFVGGAFPSGTVTFNDGVASQNITIAVAGDFNFEQTEDFFVTLSNPSNDAVLGAQTVATGTIVNDDVLAAMGFDPAASNVQQSQAEGNAGTTVYSFVVNRVNNTQVTSSVAYAVTANTANPADGADFVGGSLPSGILEFAVGDDSQTIEIAIAADTTIEEDEGFTLSLSSNNNGSLTTPTTATAIIENDDFITPTISLDVANGAPQQQAEGAVGAGAVFTFEVNRANANGSTLLSYAVVGVGANPVTGADFVGGVLPSGTVVFGSSSVTSQSINVNVLGDADIEADESFTIEFSNPTNAAIDNASNPTVTIVNDDFATPVVGFVAGSDIAENEGDTGNTPFTFTVNRSITTGDIATSQVTYTVAGSGANPANADDFAGALQGTLNFAQGVPSQTITVLVAGDSDVEPDENFTVTLAVADNATLGTVVATGTITNDDAVAIVAFDADSTSISQNEGDGGQTTNYTFQVNRTVNTSGVVTVDFEVTGGVGSLARVGDFVGGAFPSGTVTFNDGVTSQNITIAVAGDFNFEQTEDFFVTLSNPSNDAVLGAQTVATGTIVNDDVLAAMGFDPAASNVQQSQAEGNAGTTVYSFVVNRVNNTQVTSSVAYAVTANTADGADFVGGSLPSGILEFAVGDDSQTIEIAIAADTTIEEDEGFTLSLSSNNNGSLTTPTTATAIIENDDFITPTISLDVANGAPQQQAEGAVGAGAVFTFEVNRANANGSTLLNYAVRRC